MGLFGKSKKCDICGGDYNLITGAAVKDGNICLNCVKKYFTRSERTPRI